jgi:probable HAF family extracellular repeat protein
MRFFSPLHTGRLTAVLLAATLASLSANAASYVLTDLGRFRIPVAIDGRGDIVVQGKRLRVLARHDGHWHLVAQGTALRGFRAFGMNGRADITGDDGTLPMLWRAGKDGMALPLPPNAFSATGTGIDDARTVVGTFAGMDGTLRCFQWTAEGGSIDLGFMGTGNSCGASAVNNAGQITGGASASVEHEDPPHAFVYEQGVFRDLGLLPGGTISLGSAINDRGDVVGMATLPPFDEIIHAVVWPAGGDIVDLDPQGLFAESIASSINDSGEVVGTVTLQGVGGRQKGVRFDGRHAVQLESEVLNLGAWTLEQAVSVNKRGEIVGAGTAPDGEQHGFLLEPQ